MATRPPQIPWENNLDLDKRGGYVKIWRSLLDSAIWQEGTAAAKLVAIVCVSEANYRPKKCLDGTTIPRGSFMTTLPKLAKKAGVTVKQTRTALAMLEQGQFLGSKRAGRGRMITVTNYNAYQSMENGEGRIRAVKGQDEGSFDPEATFEINDPRGAKQVRREEEEEREAFHLRGVLQAPHEYGDHAEEREGKNGLPTVDAMAQRFLRALQDPRT